MGNNHASATEIASSLNRVVEIAISGIESTAPDGPAFKAAVNDFAECVLEEKDRFRPRIKAAEAVSQQPFAGDSGEFVRQVRNNRGDQAWQLAAIRNIREWAARWRRLFLDWQKSDTKYDKGKRPITAALARCAAELKQARRQNPKLTKATFLRDYEDPDGESTATLDRGLSDHPQLWKRASKSDKS
jgi:hypothetical protein